MCDCYEMTCKCRKFYVPIHITDYRYPRDIIRQAYRFRCSNIEKRREQDSLFKRLYRVDYCSVYKKKIWKIRDCLKHDCRHLKPRTSRSGSGPV